MEKLKEYDSAWENENKIEEEEKNLEEEYNSLLDDEFNKLVEEEMAQYDDDGYPDEFLVDNDLYPKIDDDIPYEIENYKNKKFYK